MDAIVSTGLEMHGRNIHQRLSYQNLKHNENPSPVPS